MSPRPATFLWAMLAAAAIAAAALFALGAWQERQPEMERYVRERKMAEALGEGRAAPVATQINETAFRWETVPRLAAAPRAALFGSSHGLRVTGEMVGTDSFHNFSVSGAVLTDHLVTAELLRRHDRRPHHWIVVVDPWLFHPWLDFGAWRKQAEALGQIGERLARAAEPRLTRPLAPVAPPPRFPWYRRIALEPLLLRLDTAIREWTERVPDAEALAGRITVFAVDGAVVVPPDVRAISTTAARDLALRQFAVNTDRHRYGTYAPIDDELWAYFTRWLAEVRTDGGRVWLVLTPYHPVLFGRIVAHPDNQLRALEKRLRNHAAEVGDPIVGSFDPALAGIGEAGFYDGDHLREEALAALLAPIAAALAAEEHDRGAGN